MESNPKNSGRFTTEEVSYIKENADKLSANEMAAQLGRDPKSVRAYANKYRKSNESLLAIKENHKDFDIEKSPLWKEIEAQFTKDEQKKFLYHWSNIILQFKYDVLPTERMQIIDVCRIELLMDRSLVKMRDIQVNIEDMKKTLEAERKKPKIANDPEDRQDPVVIQQLMAMVADATLGSANFQKDYQTLFDKKQVILKEIKGTREQRIKRIEDSKESLLTWIATLAEETELRVKLGREMEKMRLAAQVEFERLSEYHKFTDGEIEQPILTHYNLKEDNN